MQHRFRGIAQLVERILGKDEVSSSNLDSSSIEKPLKVLELQVVFLFSIFPVSPAGNPFLSSEMPKIGSDFPTFWQLNFWMVCSTLCVRELVIFVSNIHRPESFD